MTKIEFVLGDITNNWNVDVVVNAASQSLLGGAGVDGAIHSAAGPELFKECFQLGGCKTGQAKITNSYNMPCKRIIHAVGPKYYGGNYGEENLLASTYTSALLLAKANKFRSIAFPSISTGAFGYPVCSASKVALATILNFIKTDDWFERIVFVLYDVYTLNIYKSTYKKLTSN